MRRHSLNRPRRGAATVEMAILSPLLVFLFVIGVDYARVFFHSQKVASGARTGALYGCRDATKAADTTGIRNAVLADMSELSPAPNVNSAITTDENGNPAIRVTVDWTFRTLTSYPLIPNQIVVTRTVQMRIAPLVPNQS